MNVAGIENFVVKVLGTQLSPNLHYHNLAHTLDVVSSSMRIAGEEGVVNTEELILLKTAAFLHDIGFLNTILNHEEEGCLMARAILPDYDYSESEMDVICNMIMKTKLPQLPTTLLEKILCDADLDHLGRSDFKDVSNRLWEEWKALNKVDESADWNAIQYNFVLKHQFWTASSQRNRNATKAGYLKELHELMTHE